MPCCRTRAFDRHRGGIWCNIDPGWKHGKVKSEEKEEEKKWPARVNALQYLAHPDLVPKTEKTDSASAQAGW